MIDLRTRLERNEVKRKPPHTKEKQHIQYKTKIFQSKTFQCNIVLKKKKKKKKKQNKFTFTRCILCLNLKYLRDLPFDFFFRAQAILLVTKGP